MEKKKIWGNKITFSPTNHQMHIQIPSSHLNSHPVWSSRPCGPAANILEVVLHSQSPSHVPWVMLLSPCNWAGGLSIRITLSQSWHCYLPEAPPPNTLQVRISTWEFWRDAHTIARHTEWQMRNGIVLIKLGKKQEAAISQWPTAVFMFSFGVPFWCKAIIHCTPALSCWVVILNDFLPGPQLK